MKKNLLYTLVIGLAMLASCGGSDETPAPHQVGTWDLNSFIVTNTPSSHSLNENAVYQIDRISFGGVTYQKYTLDLLNDGTYTRKIEVPVGPSINDSGTWTLNGDDFTLESSDDFTDEFKVARNATDQLWLSEPRSFLLMPNNILDTLTTAYVATLTADQFFALHNEVTVDFVNAFERETN